MYPVDDRELAEINGGVVWWGPVAAVIAGGLAYELITEGFKQCVADFKAGFESTQR